MLSDPALVERLGVLLVPALLWGYLAIAATGATLVAHLTGPRPRS